MSGPVKQTPLPGMKKAAAPAPALPAWLGELPLIRRALLCFALTLLASLILLSLSAAYRERAAQQFEFARHARAAAASLFNHAEAEKGEIRLYEPQFLALRQRGLIGEENRLAWIDAIRLSQEQRKLLPIGYEISAQQTLQVPTPMAMGQYQLRGSRMQLHLDLLHELDLLNLLDDLRQAGYFAVQECTLKRNGAGGPPAGATSALSADCSLLWLTLGSVAVPVQGLP
ncbi:MULTISPECIES: hypothetical protein [unclassified Janthinobacterium]|uniref:hypothetical protein n=1 Tax=unclassified Janthinobacterium TaxID=2610881 RepID=UPI00088E8BDF|nr:MULTISPECIES: hypothetical protein [unclassified Janthinobacterium]SDA74195.1 hypothetical protein SAMN03159349_03895 [Janthinobacterium sp. 551a]SFB59015.1 hypothetical protein SAMN03159300_108222 [Janthinobacterium sp. 344]